MATPLKTLNQPLVALQAVASAAIFAGTPLDVSTKIGGNVNIHLGRTVTAALTNGVKVRIEGAAKSTEGFWFPIAELISLLASSTTTATMTGAAAAGQKVIPMTATAGIVIGDKLYIQDVDTIANGEWARVVLVTANTSVTVEENLINSHATSGGGTKIWSQAEFWTVPVDFTAWSRVRAVVDSAYALPGQTVHCEVLINTFDSF